MVAPPPAGAGAHPSIAGSGWQAAWNTQLVASTVALRTALACSPTFSTWTEQAGPNETRPVNCLSWFEAFAFCAWDGGRLATEAEWNFASAGGSEQRVFPWSSPPGSSDLSVLHASYWVNGSAECMGDGVPGCSLQDLVVAGTKTPGLARWGHADMGGNVWEWVLDAYQNPYGIVPCNDCAKLGTGVELRVLRGGSFYGSSSTIYASTRNPGDPTARYYTVGVRCARTP